MGNTKDSNEEEILILLRITKKCNQKCIFCILDEKTIYLDSNSIFQEIEKNINNQVEDKKIVFELTGGEPTLHPDFFKIVDYIYNSGHFIGIQTNVITFANPRLINSLEKYLDKMEFFVSFHSSIEKAYDVMTNTKGQFNLAVSGIKNILNKGGYKAFGLNIVINKFNSGFLQHYFDFIGKNFYSIDNGIWLNFSLPTNIYRYPYGKNLLIKMSDFIEEINNNSELIKKYNIKIVEGYGGLCDIQPCIGKKLFFYKNPSFGEYIGEFTDRYKPNRCNNCMYEKNCNGILKLYSEKYGDEEFEAIINYSPF